MNEIYLYLVQKIVNIGFFFFFFNTFQRTKLKQDYLFKFSPSTVDEGVANLSFPAPAFVNPLHIHLTTKLFVST